LPVDSFPVSVVLFILGVGAIWLGGSRLPETGKVLAERLGISATALGLFVLSIVTSLPELAVTLWAMLGEGAPDLALGNILGSNNFNITTIVALEIGFAGVFLHRVGSTRYLRTGVLLLAMTATVGLGILGGGLRVSPLFHVLIFGLPMAALFVYDTVTHRGVMAGAVLGAEERAAREDTESRDASRGLAFRFSLLAALVVIGGFLTARGANGIAVHPFDRVGAPLILGQTFVGTLLVAIATSMPEVSVAYSAVRRAGSPDMALGTLLGSNSINILVFTVGTPLMLLRFSRSAWSEVSDANSVSVLGGLVLTLLMMVGVAGRKWKRGALATRAATCLMLPVYALCLFLVYRWT
jgi:cation:H+ antiporter